MADMRRPVVHVGLGTVVLLAVLAAPYFIAAAVLVAVALVLLGAAWCIDRVRGIRR